MADTRSLEEIVKSLMNTTGSAQDNYVRPDYLSTIDPSIRGVDDLSSLLGVNFTYDRRAIESIYQDATKAAFNASNTAQKNSESAFNRSMASAQDSGLDTIRQLNNSAIASGANKGMQAANVLSTILGNSQAAAEQATGLMQDRQKMIADYATQMKEDSVNALKYSNEMASSIGQLAHQYYNDDIQQLTAQLAYNQGINTDYAGVEANRLTSQNNLLANIASAGSGVYNNNNTALATIEAALQAANAQKYSADVSAASNRDVAKAQASANLQAAIEQANASKYAADKNQSQNHTYTYIIPFSLINHLTILRYKVIIRINNCNVRS